MFCRKLHEIFDEGNRRVDNENRFKTIKKADTYSIKQIKTLIEFMKKVSNRFDNKHVFELDKIERMIKIKSY